MGKPKKTKNDYMKRLRSLIDIGVALSSEKELNNLLKILLEKSIDVTQADGANIYLVRESSKQDKGNVITLQRESCLYFLKSINRAQGQTDQSGTLPIDSKSIAGYVAVNKELLNIANCADIDKQSPFQLSERYDKTGNLETKSMLTIPMITADGKVRGILQLFNKTNDTDAQKSTEKKDVVSKNIIPFEGVDEELMLVFASYAAIALENSQLTESIENLFESFVRASVKAIEARDPTTSGHSDRVAMMTVELALATHNIKEGPFKNVLFSEDQIKEVRYASLLHDFGKIGVTEPVLQKKKKLKDRELESVLLRFDTIGYSEETLVWKNLCERLMEQQDKSHSSFNPQMAYKNAIKTIDGLKFRLKRMRSAVITANEPQIMSEDFDIDELLAQIVEANEQFNNSVLTHNQIKTLSIPRGSLNEEERKEIESHVDHTYNFLKQIAWTDNLSHITAIAHCHHEKNDGSGYPRGIREDEIPIQSRMMTIADIYDALTAFDRPYKKSLPAARALEILVKEARAGKLDGHLLKIFIEAGIFHHATLGTVKKAS